jgi:hypothetical protein
MPRPSKLRRDLNETAFDVVQAATRQADKPQPAGEQHNPEAAARGKQGGKKGGKARALKLTKKRKVEIARRAAKARWRGKPTT